MSESLGSGFRRASAASPPGASFDWRRRYDGPVLGHSRVEIFAGGADLDSILASLACPQTAAATTNPSLLPKPWRGEFHRDAVAVGSAL